MEKSRDMRSDSECLDDLLAAIEELERQISERDERREFNIFEVVGIVNAEIRHSNTIAWLMNPNGGHGLGGKVLAGLIEYAGGVPPEDMGGFAIRREADNIDILAVSATDRMTLAIENKVWSGEHDDQLGRYRRAVERRYRGWKHLYLYLTPNDDSPENDEDAAVWETLGYGSLAVIVEDAMEGAEAAPKARILIGDYLECIRRHIVGDEELSERCVQIYAEHKRALDLILSNLPDTTKAVHDHAREWARRVGGAYVVEKCSGGRHFVRFRSHRVDEVFPPIESTDSWGQSSFWFYEIVTNETSDGLGCTMKLQLCFNHTKKAVLPGNRREAMARFVEAFSGDGSGAFYKAGYSGYVGKKARYNAGACSYMDVAEALDDFWADFLAREERAVEEMR